MIDIIFFFVHSDVLNLPIFKDESSGNSGHHRLCFFHSDRVSVSLRNCGAALVGEYIRAVSYYQLG